MAITSALQFGVALRCASRYPLWLQRPYQGWSWSTYPLLPYRVVTVDTLRYFASLTFDRGSLLQTVAKWRCIKLCAIFFWTTLCFFYGLITIAVLHMPTQSYPFLSSIFSVFCIDREERQIQRETKTIPTSQSIDGARCHSQSVSRRWHSTLSAFSSLVWRKNCFPVNDAALQDSYVERIGLH